LSSSRTLTSDELVQIPLPGAVGFTTQWQNAGSVEGKTLEATFEAQMYRSGTTSWRLGLTADRSRNKVVSFNRSCVRTATISYRCTGEEIGTMWGNAFVHDLSQLPASQSTAAAGTFEVNDDGILVAVGPGSHYTQANSCGAAHTSPCWGTTVVSNGTTY